jgi:tether containing UBX domain for GLUT4
MYLVGDTKKITIIMSELNQFIKDNKIAQSTFDPYKGSISSLSGNEEKLKKVQTTEVNFEDLYYNEIERRNDIIRKSKIERKPKLYELEKNYSLNRIINTINQNEEDLISNSNEDKLIIKKNLALLKEKENDRFTLKSRTRLEQLMKTPIYVKSDIRLKFPNEIILQGSFALYETIGDIYKFINNYLKDKNEKFNISTTPPLKRYLKMDNTIQEEKLYPNLLMYVNFEEQFSGLDEEKIKDIKCNLELMDLVEEEEEEIFTGPGQKVGGQ